MVPFFAVPTHKDLPVPFVLSLFDALKAIEQHFKGRYYWQIMEDLPVPQSRSFLCKQFLATDADRLFWIDYDMIFTPRDVLRMLKLSETRDIVGGVYCTRNSSEKNILFFPVVKSANPPEDEHGTVEAVLVPSGFSVVQRHVIEKFCETPYRTINYSWDKGPTKIIFTNEAVDEDGEEMTEDATFCLKAKELGFKIYADPHTLPGHIGRTVFRPPEA